MAVSSNGGVDKPNPLDPTPRTMEQMSQAISGLKELLFARMSAYDEAIRLLQEFANSQPTPGVIYAELRALKELTAARIDEGEKRVEQIRMSDKSSLDIALTASKEASMKSEAAFTEQVRTISEQIRTLTAALEARINDVKERIDRGEGSGQGSKQSYGAVSVVVGIILSVASASILLVSLLTRS